MALVYGDAIQVLYCDCVIRVIATVRDSYPLSQFVDSRIRPLYKSFAYVQLVWHNIDVVPPNRTLSHLMIMKRSSYTLLHRRI